MVWPYFIVDFSVSFFYNKNVRVSNTDSQVDKFNLTDGYYHGFLKEMEQLHQV